MRDVFAELDFAKELALEAGEITLRYFNKSPKVELKDDRSFVTQADREAESFLRKSIAAKFPDDAILGEEEGERAGASGRKWIVDPIDGTFSFVHGVPFYGVMIALLVDAEPVLGVVNLPALGELVSAARGLGCFMNGEAARVSSTAKLEDALLLCTDFGSCAAHGFGAACHRLEKRVAARRGWGDCYGHILVATGRADVMLDPIMNIWDCAALLPIVQEAGGTFTDWTGRSTIEGGNAIATNGLLLPSVMETLNPTSDF